MGKHQLRLLRFAIKYPGWHSCGRDQWGTAQRLAGLGLLELNPFKRGGSVPGQFRLNLGEWYQSAIDAATKAEEVASHG